MNIFGLDNSPIISAQMMCDKHVVKMILETAQLLSTAHRIIDGQLYLDKTKNNRKIKRYLVPDTREETLYKASHINHPCNVWTRQTNNNYTWLYCHFKALCEEYTYRYGKIHSTEQKLLDILTNLPYNISVGPLMPLPQAMPDKYKRPSAVAAYRAYYIGEKSHIAKWTKRSIPDWFKETVDVSSKSS